MKKLWELFFSFFKIGFFTIGGGMAMLPLVQDTVVNKKKWMTEPEMIDCFAVAQSLPGAVILNTATYVGRKEKSLPGSIAATVGVIVPSFICMITFISILDVVGDNQYIDGFFKGAMSAAAGLIAVACFRLGKSIYKDPIDLIIMIVAFALTIFLKVSVVWIILGSIPLGFIIYQVRKKIESKKEGRTNE